MYYPQFVFIINLVEWFEGRYGIRVTRYKKIEGQIRDESKRVTKRLKADTAFA